MNVFRLDDVGGVGFGGGVGRRDFVVGLGKLEDIFWDVDGLLFIFEVGRFVILI